MTAFKDHYFSLIRAFTLLFKGHFLIFFVPGLIIAVFFYFYTSGLNFVNSSLHFFEKIPWIGTYVVSATDTLFGWVNSLSIYMYQFTIITLLSPFHTELSQRVETHENGKQFANGWAKFFKDILRTIGVAFLGGIMYFIIYLMWILIAWVFGLSFLSPIVSIILIGFFTGFNSYDYSLERHNISVKKSWSYAFNHPLQMTLIGVMFTLLLYI